MLSTIRPQSTRLLSRNISQVSQNYNPGLRVFQKSFATSSIDHNSHKMSPRRFAPIPANAKVAKYKDAMELKGIIFDMDGTLCKPQNHMFGEMRAAVGVPHNTDILLHIHSLPAKEQQEAMDKIQEIERAAMPQQQPQPGLVEMLEYLDKHEMKKAILTRNFDAPVVHLIETHIPSHIKNFAPVITREFRPPKPSPAGIWHIAREWGVIDSIPESIDRKPLPLIMVGDSIDDMTAGRDAGALTVLVRSPGKERLETDDQTDVVIDRLDELIGLLEKGVLARK